MARTIVLADLHLCSDSDPRTLADLCRLVREHAGARLIFAGDLLDVSSERSPSAPRDLASALEARPDVRAALGRHVETGGQLWMVAGNHDAELGALGDERAVARALGLSNGASARIRVTPWFFRDGALHIEHGHLFDPDNAPAHPLVVGTPSLGVHFSREFIAKTGAYAYINANDDTPLKLFLSAFTWYGRRAPHVVYCYFRAAFAAMLQSGPLYRGGAEREMGDGHVEAFARSVGLPVEAIYRALAHKAAPTLESSSRTFTRLYFDRVIATITMAAGLGTIATGAHRGGAATFGLGALLMGLSWSRGHDRYSGTVADRLRAGAQRIGDTGARLVVMGHTHREALEEGYANTGSFAFPRGAPGRPFLEIEGDRDRPRAVRRYLSAATTS